MIVKYRIPNETSVIADNAFRRCHNLRFIFIPPTVKYIGERAFADCNIRFIELPEAITYISDTAFYGCNNLNLIVIPPNTYDKFSALLPYNALELFEAEKTSVKKHILSIIDEERKKGMSLWKATENFFGLLNNSYGNYFLLNNSGKHGWIKFYEYEYEIINSDDIDEVIDATYHLLLDLKAANINNSNKLLQI